MLDDIAQAVLAREEVVEYLSGGYGERGDQARERIYGYLDELRTTQRYRDLPRAAAPALPDSPQDRAHAREPAPRRRAATRGAPRRLRLEPQEPHRLPGRAARARRQRHPAAAHRRRHQPVRRPARPDPPARHRRDSDPPQHQGSGVPDHAQGLRRRDAEEARPVLLSGRRPQLQRRAEAGEDRPDSRGADRRTARTSSIVPTAIAYDLVLEDHILARQRVKKQQRPFTRELAEMVRYAVGYRSRAFVTFGAPIPVAGVRPAVAQRRARADAHWSAARIGTLYKVLPTAVFAAAMRPSITRRDLEERIDRLIEELAAGDANLGVTQRPPGGRRSRRAARNARHHRRSSAAGSASATATCCATTPARIEHLLVDARPHALSGSMFDSASKAFFHLLARSTHAEDAWRRATACASRRSFARRFIAGETVDEAIAAARARRGAGAAPDARLPRRERRDARPRPTPRRATTCGSSTPSSRSGIERNLSLKLTQLGLDVDRATCVDNLRRILDARRRVLRAHRHGELAVHRRHARHLRDAVAAGLSQHRRRAAVGPVPHRAGRRADERARRARPAGQRRVPEPKSVAYQQKADVDAAYVRLMQAAADRGHTIRRSPRTTRR